MDLAILDTSAVHEHGADLDVRHPGTGDPIGLRIRLASYKSKRVDKVSKRIINERLKNNRKRPTAEMLERNALETVVAAVVSWQWDEGTTLDGTVWECTPQNVEKLFQRLPFVREQADEFCSDPANYMAEA